MGAIYTLAVDRMKFRSVRRREASDLAPNFRVMAATTTGILPGRRPARARTHLSVRLDGRSFGMAIPCALLVMDGVHTLVWSRGAGPKED